MTTLFNKITGTILYLCLPILLIVAIYFLTVDYKAISTNKHLSNHPKLWRINWILRLTQIFLFFFNVPYLLRSFVIGLAPPEPSQRTWHYLVLNFNAALTFFFMVFLAILLAKLAERKKCIILAFIIQLVPFINVGIIVYAAYHISW